MNEQKKILVVDDEIALGQLRKQVLESVGYDVIATTSAKVALSIAKHEQFDLILSDVMMPEMNGIQFVKALRTAGINTPAIAITAGTPGITTEELKQNFASIFSEPLSNADLVQLVKDFFLPTAPS